MMDLVMILFVIMCIIVVIVMWRMWKRPTWLKNYKGKRTPYEMNELITDYWNILYDLVHSIGTTQFENKVRKAIDFLDDHE